MKLEFIGLKYQSYDQDDKDELYNMYMIAKPIFNKYYNHFHFI